MSGHRLYAPRKQLGESVLRKGEIENEVLVLIYGCIFQYFSIKHRAYGRIEEVGSIFLKIADHFDQNPNLRKIELFGSSPFHIDRAFTHLNMVRFIQDCC